jgi:hypothetical protein
LYALPTTSRDTVAVKVRDMAAGSLLVKLAPVLEVPMQGAL